MQLIKNLILVVLIAQITVACDNGDNGDHDNNDDCYIPPGIYTLIVGRTDYQEGPGCSFFEIQICSLSDIQVTIEPETACGTVVLNDRDTSPVICTMVQEITLIGTRDGIENGDIIVTTTDCESASSNDCTAHCSLWVERN